LEVDLNIAKVQVDSDTEVSILKVIPNNYRIHIAPGVGFGIYDVNNRMVGSCKMDGESKNVLVVYAYEISQKIMRAFIAAFELHNSTDEVECTFIEVK
jgi:hypothetical protein